ncbi:uncharacterized protein GGS25DRAFT_517918 [Hypoxylon fragiforme]|uniref:uncharacterized protein n=1 Tax=Hypoxylon fragiforme TaxID=63214 RepID=UPI0020C68963|nr:uncharacterized protein GGS25DRAFT_517918 [Hypoxylon fragiforme]KAI2612222.1 hypothetical protein GGS25DRAFT_517918 [Hypoxylon fragiforme]
MQLPAQLWGRYKETETATVKWESTRQAARIGGAFILISLALLISLPHLPPLSLSLSLFSPQTQVHPPHHQTPSAPPSPHTASPKLALLIETRPLPHLAPLLLHFIGVTPPTWRFHVLGSDASLSSLKKSASVRAHVASGKLSLGHVPAGVDVGTQEGVSRLLTERRAYEVGGGGRGGGRGGLLPGPTPAEHLLVFQPDSMLCARSARSVDDYLGHDWVGAPWRAHDSQSGERFFGGNGGLSLRRVRAVLEVLRSEARAPGSEAEDVWFAERLARRPGARTASGTVALSFSGEEHAGEPDGSNHATSRRGFYEPMGYHTGGSGTTLHPAIWGTPSLRKHIWEYCPEIKLILAMDAAEYVPGECRSTWRKRGHEGHEQEEAGKEGEVEVEEKDHSGVGHGHGTEIIDGVEYPLLPANLAPW